MRNISSAKKEEKIFEIEVSIYTLFLLKKPIYLILNLLR